MRIVTIASLGASAVLGVAALFVARTWLPTSTQSSASAASSQAVKNLKPMVVAAKALPYGARLTSADLRLAQVPGDFVPPGAFVTIESVLTQDAGKAPVVVQAIAANEPILPTKVTGPGARPSVAIQIAEGKRAYAIRVSDVAGVGGNILPGDRVDVMLMRDLSQEGSLPNLVSEVVIQNIRLLGLDLNVDPASTDTGVRSTATVEVTVEDAQKLAMVGQLGTLSLVLRRTGAAEIEAVKPLRTTDMRLAGMAAPRASAPAGSRPTTAAAKPAAPRRPTLVIVNGDKRDPVEVPAESSRGGI